MSADLEALVAAVLADPDAAAPRLAVAAYLDANGELGNFLRKPGCWRLERRRGRPPTILCWQAGKLPAAVPVAPVADVPCESRGRLDDGRAGRCVLAALVRQGGKWLCRHCAAGGEPILALGVVP
jgi:hypothetical protein